MQRSGAKGVRSGPRCAPGHLSEVLSDSRLCVKQAAKDSDGLPLTLQLLLGRDELCTHHRAGEAS